MSMDEIARPPHTHSAPTPSAFTTQQRTLARFNRHRLTPGFGEPIATAATLRRLTALEQSFLDDCRREVAQMAASAPTDAAAFVAWFEDLAQWGPGQHDSLFPWLAEQASFEEMRWFLHQEVAGEAGFDDLVAMTQLKMPVRAKLEMARNYWDEMGQGRASAMHGPMLERLSEVMELHPDIDDVVPEALALGNLMLALAYNRSFAFHAVGALGVIELTAPDRAALVHAGLKRLNVAPDARRYYAVHSVLDRHHAREWNREVIGSLVAEDARRAPCIAEGALLRLARGRACFDAYKRHLGLPVLDMAPGSLVHIRQ